MTWLNWTSTCTTRGATRMPCGNPSTCQTNYKDKRANPKGRVPVNVWELSRVWRTFRKRIKGRGYQTLLERALRLTLPNCNPTMGEQGAPPPAIAVYGFLKTN